MTIPSPSVGDLGTVDIADQAAANGFIGDLAPTASATLSDTTASHPVGLGVTFTLPEQRRVRIVVSTGVNMASGTSGTYLIRIGYNGGDSIVPSGITTLDPGFHLPIYNTATPISGTTEATVLLAAGTYTAYPTVQRVSGGSATDSASNSYVAVYGVGTS